MTYMRPLRGQYVECTESAPRSFEVTEITAIQWAQLVASAQGERPRDIRGRLLRPYGALDVASHAPYAPDGVYVDHRDPGVEQAAYELRDRLNRDGEASNQSTLQPLADEFGLRHWRDAYNAVRNVGRRATGESGRDADGNLRWRAWNSPRNMRTTPAAPARIGSRSDGSLVARPFGVEIEFDRGTGGYSQRDDIVALLVAQNIRAQVEGYNHTVQPHWKMTSDVTVSGGELVSPIMAGDTASLDEVRDCIRAVKDAGGTATRTVGMHVHHNVTDFDSPASRQRLVDGLHAAEHAMSRYVVPARVQGLTAHGAGTMSDREWELVRESVQNIIPGQGGAGAYQTFHGCTVDRYRFFNIEGPMNKYGSVEFRGLGGTLHAGKVRVWVRMGQAVIEAARLGVHITMDCEPQELVDTLRDANLIGRRTGERFVSECTRRYPV